jgi:hypothetical protein
MRKTFANTIRPDLQVSRGCRGVTVTGRDQFGNRLTYSSQRANAQIAETLNSKMPVAVLTPPRQ